MAAQSLSGTVLPWVGTRALASAATDVLSTWCHLSTVSRHLRQVVLQSRNEDIRRTVLDRQRFRYQTLYRKTRVALPIQEKNYCNCLTSLRFGVFVGWTASEVSSTEITAAVQMGPGGRIDPVWGEDLSTAYMTSSIKLATS